MNAKENEVATHSTDPAAMLARILKRTQTMKAKAKSWRKEHEKIYQANADEISHDHADVSHKRSTNSLRSMQEIIEGIFEHNQLIQTRKNASIFLKSIRRHKMPKKSINMGNGAHFLSAI